jgi:hypothetical protein
LTQPADVVAGPAFEEIELAFSRASSEDVAAALEEQVAVWV